MNILRKQECTIDVHGHASSPESDKQGKKPVVIATNDPYLLPRDPENRNISRNLEENERPIPIHFYNKFMGAVDVFDAMLTKYTVAQRVGKRRDKTAWLKKTSTYIFDVFCLNVFSLWREKYSQKKCCKFIQACKNHQWFAVQCTSLGFHRNVLRCTLCVAL